MKITAIIPAFNRAAVIRRSIDSALRELDEHDELLIVDDGSTDATGDLIAAIPDTRIRYVRQENRGAGAARNRGFAEATGDLVAYLDSDDEWLPGKIHLQRRFMEAAREVLFCFTDFQRDYASHLERHSIHTWHADPRPWGQILGVPVQYSSLAPLEPGMPDFPVYRGDLYRSEMRHNYILTSCIMIRRREAEGVLHFTEGSRTFEDWECFGRLARAGKAAFLEIETAIQHAHAGPRLTDADLLTCAEARLTVLGNVWGSDPGFLSVAGDEYRALVHEQELSRIKGLLQHGQSAEARLLIRNLSSVPPVYRLLSSIPGPVLTKLLAARRRFKSVDPHAAAGEWEQKSDRVIARPAH